MPDNNEGLSTAKASGSIIYYNGLTEDSITYTELYILCQDRRSGAEVLIDALLPDDRIATVFNAMKEALPVDGKWSLIESWGIEEEAIEVRTLVA